MVSAEALATVNVRVVTKLYINKGLRPPFIYLEIALNQLLRACSHEPGTVNYPGVMIALGQALPRVHMMICCPGATLPRGKFKVI